MPQTILRGLATGSHFMIFASAAIVTGLISHFLHQTDFRNAHLVYEEVIVSPTPLVLKPSKRLLSNTCT